MKKVEIQIFYPKCDKDFKSDYWYVKVLIDDKIIKSYNDHYHDKGLLKAKAFVEGLMYIQKDIKFFIKNVISDSCYGCEKCVK